MGYHLAAASDPGADDWTVLRSGISVRELFDDGRGYRIAMLRYAAGSHATDHMHSADEHAYVLEGSVSDEGGEYGPGAYLLNPAGSRHSMLSREGCVVIMHWIGPVRLMKGEML